MQIVTSFVCQVLVLSMLTMTAEFLLPAGHIKSTASVAVRITYVAAICDEIIGIFTRLGV